MKAFALGVAVGGLVCLAVTWVIDGRTVEPQKAESVTVDAVQSVGVCPGEPSSPSKLDEARLVQAGSQPVRPALARANSPYPEPVASLPTQADSSAGLTKKRFTLDELSEKDANELCSYAARLQGQRERAQKDAEPKDPGWAYSTEQLIRQHIESYVPRDQYTELRVECRTTFCELEAEGTISEGRDILDKAAQSIPKQPWSNVMTKGTSGGSDGNGWRVAYTWSRAQSESERRRWRALQEQQTAN